MTSNSHTPLPPSPEPDVTSSGQASILPRQMGQYQLLRLLGRGGMGDVYEALHVRLNRRVALKVLRQRLNADVHAIQRFQREMSVIGQLNHSHIVQAFDAGEFEDTIYLVMEFVDGYTAENLAQERGPLPVGIACEIVRQVSMGLQHAHEHGFVHRDVKPSNILISKDLVKVSDLGLAKMQDEGRDNNLTSTGVILGTPDYISPEQVEGTVPVDGRADLYSLGCTLYRLLAGRPPFGLPIYGSGFKKVLAHVRDTPQSVRDLRPDLPLSLVDIIEKLLAKRPNDRFSCARELAEALAPFAENHGLAAFVTSAPDSQDTTKANFSHDPTAVITSSADPGSRLLSFAERRFELPRRLSVRKTIAAALVIAICGVLGVYLSGLFPYVSQNSAIEPGDSLSVAPPKIDESDSAVGTPATDTIASAMLPPRTDFEDQWLKAVGELPQELVWPDRRASGAWRVDSELQALTITTPIDATRFIQLGTLDGKDAEIGIDLQPQGWNSSRGLFLGFHQNASNGEPSFQSIELSASAPSDTGVPTVVIRRQKATFKRGNPFAYILHEVKSREFRGDVSKFRLSVRVKAGRLETVRLGEEPCPELVTDSVAAEFSDRAYFDGPWGVYHAGQTTLFSSPLYR